MTSRETFFDTLDFLSRPDAILPLGIQRLAATPSEAFLINCHILLLTTFVTSSGGVHPPDNWSKDSHRTRLKNRRVFLERQQLHRGCGRLASSPHADPALQRSFARMAGFGKAEDP